MVQQRGEFLLRKSPRERGEEGERETKTQELIRHEKEVENIKAWVTKNISLGIIGEHQFEG